MARFVTAPIVAGIIFLASSASAQDTIFTYQGELQEDSTLANGLFDMDFSLWDSVNGGSQIGATIVLNDISVSDGKFSVELDFGADSFNNNDRWLEIVVEGFALSPRTSITRAPYAIQTRGIYVAPDLDVSIGTTSNPYRFQVFTDDRERAIYGNNFDNSLGDKFGVFGRATSVDGYGVFGIHEASSGTRAGVYGETDSNSSRAVGVHGVVDTASAGSFSAAVRGENRGTGLTGIGVYGSHNGQGWGVYGTTSGGLGRAVMGEVTGNGGIAGYFQNNNSIAVFADGVENNGASAALMVSSGSQTMYLDGNEIDSDDSGGLYLNNNNNNDVVLAFGGGDVRVPNSNSILNVRGLMSSRFASIGYNEHPGPALVTQLDNDSAHTVTHIRFEAPAIAGSITSFQGVVSYNAFTGSHYVSVREPVETGTLVRMTGQNSSVSANSDSEPVYGVEPTVEANDPASLGAYLSDHGDLKTDRGQPIHLVAAVGNSVMNVVDNGRGNIKPGDLLISSDIAGCAMKDDPERFKTGYTIARAAQSLDWSAIKPDTNGVKRSKISVLLDASVRVATFDDTQAELAVLRAENESLAKRLSRLESALQASIGESR